jgi:Fic family protein
MLYELDEQPSVPIEDAREVSLHVAALEHGLARLRGGFKLSLRLLREVHGVLLGHGRGARHRPREFRRSQNWIGGTRPGNAVFVPPPPQEVPECLGKLERFLHDEPAPPPPLIKAALAHAQFETIHPFLDGNGRVGRALITLQLRADGLLRAPLLYPSLHFKQHRRIYDERLNAIREAGDREAWLAFFADAVIAGATQAADSAKRLLDLAAQDRRRIEGLGRAAASTLAIHAAMTRQPIATSGSLVKTTGITPATVNKSLAHLQRLGIVAELTQRRRGRVFSYQRYAAILEEGTERPGEERRARRGSTRRDRRPARPHLERKLPTASADRVAKTPERDST